MIEFLRGVLIHVSGTGVVLDVNGVGYGLETSPSVVASLPSVGSEVKVWVYTLVREDAIRLFAFLSLAERAAFETLLGLNGVGPKVANAIIGAMSVQNILDAVMEQSSQSFAAVPGVGPRLSERILVELKPKLPKLRALLLQAGGTSQSVDRKGATLFDAFDQAEKVLESIYDDVRSALVNLGYHEKLLSPLLKKVRLEHAQLNDFQSILRQSLTELRSSSSKSDSGNMRL